MPDPEPPAPEPEAPAPEPPAPEPEAPAPEPEAPTRGDRILLAAFAVQAALLLVAAFAQVTDNRALLDLFDFRRFFVR